MVGDCVAGAELPLAHDHNLRNGALFQNRCYLDYTSLKMQRKELFPLHTRILPLSQSILLKKSTMNSTSSCRAKLLLRLSILFAKNWENENQPCAIISHNDVYYPNVQY